MKKVDLTQVKFLDIEGREAVIDIAKQIGNLLYMQGHDIVEHELGSKVYHSADKLKDWNGSEPHPDCSFEVTEEEEKALNKYIAQQYSYVVQKAVKDEFH